MSGRWRALLIVSLALNLFLAGVGAATAVRWLAERDAAEITRPQATAPLPTLSPERRRELAAELLRDRGEQRALAREMRQARRAAAARFAADPYDAPAVAAELRRARAAETVLRDRLEQSVLRYGERLTPAERRALAPVLERGVRRPGRAMRDIEGS